MELSKRTDLAFRALIYLALMKSDRATIAEVSAVYSAPKSHLMKVVNRLVRTGFIESTRGKNGGICLAVPANKIYLDKVIEAMELSLIPIDCIKQECVITGHCGLPKILGSAQSAYLQVLNQYTIADILVPSATQILNIP